MMPFVRSKPRALLLDHNVVELRASMPLDLKLGKLTREYFLRRVTRSCVRREIIDGRKKGFLISMSAWLRDDARASILDLLASEAAAKRGWVNLTVRWRGRQQRRSHTVRPASRKRILMLLENQSYPHDDRVRREANGLSEAGYEISVICPRGDGQPLYEVIDGVHVYRYRAPRARSALGYVVEYGYCTLRSFLLSFRVLEEQGFDVIHAHNPPDTFFVIGAFYKAFGKRFVYDHHDLTPEMYYARFSGKGNRLVHRTLLVLEKLSCRLADHVFTTNESYKAVELERDGVREDRISVVRNGPDLDRLEPVDRDQARQRANKTIIGYGGVMGFQDGIDYLLRAVHHLAHDLGRSDFHCLLIGPGDAVQSLQMLAAGLEIGDFVEFTGFLPHEELIGQLSAADICVDPDPSNPYNDRSTMIKLMEYMALGKPIVAFDLPEHRVTAGDAAVYVEPNDEFAFATTLAAVMDDPDSWQAMGAAGRRRVETQFHWRYSVPQLLQGYRCLEGSRKGWFDLVRTLLQVLRREHQKRHTRPESDAPCVRRAAFRPKRASLAEPRAPRISI